MSETSQGLPANILKALGILPTTTLENVVSRAGVDTSQRGRLVPNQMPSVPGAPYRVALIGEAPGAEEDQQGRPFCGASGRHLDKVLTVEGMSRPTVFVGNICNYRPPNNEFMKAYWDKKSRRWDECVWESIDRLKAEINEFNPNVIILLGAIPLYFATGEVRSISEWRGSCFISQWDSSPFKGRKCLATFHPAAVLRFDEWMPLLRNDFRKASRQATSPDLNLLKRNFATGLSVSEIERKIEDIISYYDAVGGDREVSDRVWVSFDLEGYWNRITRFSIAESPTEGFIVPITRGEFDSHWSVTEECRVWRAMARLLQDPRVPKVLQNSLYDRFVLAYLYKILISNVEYDTMLAHWELYCELPNNLGLQASIYTDEPYWKMDRDDDDLTTRELYCCKDSAVTEEIRTVQTPLLLANPAIWNHFQFNLQLLNPILFMELRGIKYDSDLALKGRDTVRAELWLLQHQLNVLAGKSFVGTRAKLLEVCKVNVCKKREAAFLVTFGQLPSLCLKAELEVSERLAVMDTAGLLTDSQLATNGTVLGEVESLLGIGLNVRSNPQMLQYLYVDRKFPRQYEKDPKTKAQRLNADVMAMLNIYRLTQDDVPKTILKIRSLLYQAKTLGILCDPDGRVRCGYNEVASETARIACYQSPTGSGYNLQTVTKKLRYLFRADDGYWFGQADLAGADGWTVAAHCKSLGDSTMLDDYLSGLKPARIIALMYMELEREITGYTNQCFSQPNMAWMLEAVARISRHFNSLSRNDLKTLCKAVDSNGWLYFGSKRVQHGSNYGAQQATISDIILKDSHKFLGEPIFVEPKVCGLLQRLYGNRYVGIPRWHSRVGTTVLQNERLVSASGRVRRFFGRLRDGREINHDTLKTALSNEPQDNTSYANNLALLNLWNDPDNRDSSRPRGLIVEPLHTVHDANCTQWPKSCTDFAIAKHKEWYNNEITIAGVNLVIPFEGAYGPSWGELDYAM